MRTCVPFDLTQFLNLNDRRLSVPLIIIIMPLFTALEVKPFSGFYPSCQQCLRRLSVTEKPRKGYTLYLALYIWLMHTNDRKPFINATLCPFDNIALHVANNSTVGDAI